MTARRATSRSARSMPAPGPPLLACRCGAVWTDDEPGRDAHRRVFDHEPREPRTQESNRR